MVLSDTGRSGGKRGIPEKWGDQGLEKNYKEIRMAVLKKM